MKLRSGKFKNTNLKANSDLARTHGLVSHVLSYKSNPNSSRLISLAH